MNATIIKWFDYALKGVANEFASGAPVRIFVMGDNVWRDEQEFPLARARATKYYLRRHEGRTRPRATGSSRPQRRARRGRTPSSTTRTIRCRRSAAGSAAAAFPPGPFDQRPNESRPDVLVYSTPPLERDTEVTGYITVELAASSSVADTDFTALLADVDASGYARFLTDGVVRARYRNSTARPSRSSRGRSTATDRPLGDEQRLQGRAPHPALPLEQQFPRFNRNLNTGEQTFGATRVAKARQTSTTTLNIPPQFFYQLFPADDMNQEAGRSPTKSQSCINAARGA